MAKLVNKESPILKLTFIFSLIVVILFCNSIYAQENKLCLKDLCINIEICDTSEKRIRGLMFREKLKDDQGMLFIFDQKTFPNIWMKNMRFALDIIWIDADKKIVDISQNALPCQGDCKVFIPREKSKYALEVNSGLVDRNKIIIGDRVNF